MPLMIKESDFQGIFPKEVAFCIFILNEYRSRSVRYLVYEFYVMW